MKFRLIIFVAVILSILPLTCYGQEGAKSAVVRIENTKHQDIGTGFILKINGHRAYVVTAAHVVSGDQHPHVYLFNRQDEPVQATVIDKQEDDLRGIALLRIDTDPSGLAELPLGSTSKFGHSESVTFVGFPGTALWTVDSGNVKRLEGSNLVLSGPAQHGNSGGPVVFKGLAVGLITDIAQPDVYATRSEIIVTYVNGFVPNLLKLSDDDQTADSKNLQQSFTYRDFLWNGDWPRHQTVMQVSDFVPQHKGQRILYTINIDSYYNLHSYFYQYKVFVNDKEVGIIQNNNYSHQPVGIGDDPKSFDGEMVIPSDGRVDIRVECVSFDNTSSQVPFGIYNGSIKTKFK